MRAVADTSPGSGEQALVEAILALVRERTGTDFRLYRTATVRRRIGNRMISVGTATLDDYLAYLAANHTEARSLLGRLTIKVSRFYRNVATFDYLRDSVIPELARAGNPLCIWSIGCGRGEEPYTLAMLLAHAGVDGMVHATDIDPEALAQAKAATYGADALGELPSGMAGQYIEQVGGPAGLQYRVCEAVRRRVVLSQHDITSDGRLPGRAAFDLVTFRNVAIYLRREVQDAAFGRALTALRTGGFLCLGEAEWPPAALERHLVCGARKLRVFRAGDMPRRGAA